MSIAAQVSAEAEDDAGPVASLAPSRVAVHAELVVTSDPRPVTGRYGDRVMLRGRLVGDFDPQTVTPQQLGSAMTGAGTEETAR